MKSLELAGLLFVLALFAVQIGASAQTKTPGTFNLAGIPEYFDGRKINGSLARDVAGNRNLLAWGNCSQRQRADGSYVTPQPGVRSTMPIGADPIPCLYIATGRENLFNEYFLIEDSCTEATGPARHRCVGGYTVDTRIRNRVRTNAPDAEYQIVHNLEFFQKLDTSAARRTTEIAANPQLNTLGKKGSARIRYQTGRSFYSYEMTIYDAAGQQVGDAIEEAVYFYTAYSSSGSSNCKAIGGVTLAAGTALTGFAALAVETTGVLVGAVGGGVIAGTAASPSGPPAILVAAEGAVAGGTIGGFVTAPVAAGVTIAGTFSSYVTSQGIEAACDYLTASPPSVGNGSGNVQKPDEDGRLTTPAGGQCYTCVELSFVQAGSTAAYTTDEDGMLTVTVEPVYEEACASAQLIDGDDADNDGWCD